MTRPAFPPVPFFAALAVLAAYTAVCLLIRMTEYGPHFNWDSMHYISVARNLLKGNGFLEADGGRFVTWPPLYPMLLAAAGALASIDPRDVAGPLNAVLLGLCVLVAGAWMRRTLDSRFLVVWGCLVVALAPALTFAATKALSDTVFILLTTLALTRMDRHLADGRYSSLVWAAIFAGLAWATRYIGIVVVVAAVAALALGRGVPLLDKAKNIFVYSLISIAPVGFWMSRNFLAAGQLTGSSRPVEYPWLEALEGIAGAIGSLLADSGVQQLQSRWLAAWPALQVALGGLALLALAAALVVSAARARREGRAGDSGSSFRLFGGFVILFCCFYAWTTVEGYTYHGADLRHLIPVYIPLLFAALLAADRFLRRERWRRLAMARWMGAGTAGGLALTLACSLWILWTAPAHLRGTLTGEGTYAELDSETMRWLRDNPSDTDLYSNDNAVPVAYFHSVPGDGFFRVLPYNRSPDPYAPSHSDPRDMLGLFLERSRHGDRIVWMYNLNPNHIYDYDDADMRAHAKLRLVADFTDGAVFEVDKNLDREARERLLAAIAGRPAVRNVFDIHIKKNRLIYSRNPCTRADTRPAFFLHVFPVDENDLPDDRKRHGFANLDFEFNRGVWMDETCAAVVELPDWKIAHVTTGQFVTDYTRIWGGIIVWKERVYLWKDGISIGDEKTGDAPGAGNDEGKPPDHFANRE